MSQGTIPTRPTAQAPMVAPGRPWIRTTYQLASVIPTSAAILAERFDAAQKCVLHWVRTRAPGTMPPEAWTGHSFRMELPGERVDCISVPEMGIWSFRYEHPDMPFGVRPAVAGRTWTTDIAFKAADDGIRVGVRAFCASRPFSDGDVVMTRPRVVLELANRLGLVDHRRLIRDAWLLQTDADLDQLHELLCSPQRTLPVVMLTQPDRNRLQVDVAPFVLDPTELGNKLLGLAHVVTLPWDLGWAWTDRVGKPWTAYLGAVRTYMPGLKFDEDAPSMHPSTFADKIIFWRSPSDDRVGEGPFTDFLVQRLFQEAAAKRVNWGDLAFLPEARTRAAEVARSKVAEGDQWKPLYEEEIAALHAKVEELEKESEEYSDDALRSAGERDYFREENRQLRHKLEALRLAFDKKVGGAPTQEIPIPDNYGDVAEWVSEHLAGRLVLHARALRGLKDARYEDPALVCRCLLLLANEYRNLRLGYEGARQALDAKLGELGVRFDQSITRERAGEQGDDYFVRFPPGSGPKQFLDWHVCKGSTKDDRLCMRIYLFWDDDTQQVVVGWLPSHLDIRST